jgi:phosphoglucomutase
MNNTGLSTLVTEAFVEKKISEAAKKNILLWLDPSYHGIVEQGKSAIACLSEWIHAKNWTELENRFYTQLAPGTAGIRGVVGIGSACINAATLGIFVQAHAHFLKNNPIPNREGILLGFDSRSESYDMSTEGPGSLVQRVAEIYAAAGIAVYVSHKPIPTPVIAHSIVETPFGAFARLPLSGGICTASHNPKEDNGFKVYESDGHQVVNKDFKEKLHQELTQIRSFAQVKRAQVLQGWPPDKDTLNSGVKNSAWGLTLQTDGAPITIVDTKKIIESYAKKACQVALQVQEKVSDNFTFVEEIQNALLKHPILITPLKGNAASTVQCLLEAHGLLENKHFYFTPLEKEPDNSLDTGLGKERGKPNPANTSSFYQSVEFAKKLKTEDVRPLYVFASDPDSDRMGVLQLADHEKKFLYFSGNEQLAINAAYETLMKTEPENALIIHSLVSGILPVKIYRSLWPKVKVHYVPVGFKYFGQIIAHYNKCAVTHHAKKNLGFDMQAYSQLKMREREKLLLDANAYIFQSGGEESMGQTYGVDTAEKDTPRAMARFSEICAWLCSKNLKMSDFQCAIQDEFGLHAEALYQPYFPGAMGDQLKNFILQKYRNAESAPKKFGTFKTIAHIDYLKTSVSDAHCVDAEGTLLFSPELKKDRFQIPGTSITVPTFYTDLGNDEGWTLESSDHLLFVLENGANIQVRPSGTEPSLKHYLNFEISDEEVFALPILENLLKASVVVHTCDSGLHAPSKMPVLRQTLFVTPFLDPKKPQWERNDRVTKILKEKNVLISDWPALSLDQKKYFLKASGLFRKHGLHALRNHLDAAQQSIERFVKDAEAEFLLHQKRAQA